MSTSRNIVWIASYPKSGNTWVRFMLCSLIFGPQNSAQTLDLRAPDIHESGADGLAPHSGLVKTHFPFSAALPLAERTAAAIYVVRRPADVLVSNFHYSRRSAAAEGSRPAFDQYFESFLERRGDPRWIDLGMGKWDDHVRSWLAARNNGPVLIVRYEDLLEDPRKSCTAMANFLQLGCSEQDIDRAVSNSSFEHMREVENADIREKRIGLFYKPYLQSAIDANLRFMRRGVEGEGESRLTQDQRARLTRVFGELTAYLGYTTV